jgi:hypothetical protein
MRRRRRPRTRPSPADNLRVWLMDWYGWEARHVRGSSPRAITKVLLIMLSSPVNSGRASFSRSMDSCSQKTNEMPLVEQLTPSYAFTTHGRSLQLKVTIFQHFLFERVVEGASPLNIAPRMGRTSRQTPTTLIYHIEYVDSTTGLRATYAQNINPKALSTVTIPALPPKGICWHPG